MSFLELKQKDNAVTIVISMVANNSNEITTKSVTVVENDLIRLTFIKDGELIIDNYRIVDLHKQPAVNHSVTKGITVIKQKKCSNEEDFEDVGNTQYISLDVVRDIYLINNSGEMIMDIDELLILPCYPIIKNDTVTNASYTLGLVKQCLHVTEIGLIRNSNKIPNKDKVLYDSILNLYKAITQSVTMLELAKGQRLNDEMVSFVNDKIVSINKYILKFNNVENIFDGTCCNKPVPPVVEDKFGREDVLKLLTLNNIYRSKLDILEIEKYKGLNNITDKVVIESVTDEDNDKAVELLIKDQLLNLSKSIVLDVSDPKSKLFAAEFLIFTEEVDKYEAYHLTIDYDSPNNQFRNKYSIKALTQGGVSEKVFKYLSYHLTENLNSGALGNINLVEDTIIFINDNLSTTTDKFMYFNIKGYNRTFYVDDIYNRIVEYINGIEDIENEFYIDAFVSPSKDGLYIITKNGGDDEKIFLGNENNKLTLIEDIYTFKMSDVKINRDYLTYDPQFAYGVKIRYKADGKDFIPIKFKTDFSFDDADNIVSKTYLIFDNNRRVEIKSKVVTGDTKGYAIMPPTTLNSLGDAVLITDKNEDVTVSIDIRHLEIGSENIVIQNYIDKNKDINIMTINKTEDDKIIFEKFKITNEVIPVVIEKEGEELEVPLSVALKILDNRTELESIKNQLKDLSDSLKNLLQVSNNNTDAIANATQEVATIESSVNELTRKVNTNVSDTGNIRGELDTAKADIIQNNQSITTLGNDKLDKTFVDINQASLDALDERIKVLENPVLP